MWVLIYATIPQGLVNALDYSVKYGMFKVYPTKTPPCVILRDGIWDIQYIRKKFVESVPTIYAYSTPIFHHVMEHG